jgi:hypothetical protein
MTFNAKEISAWDGNPVELFLFSTKDGDYYYTNADASIAYNGNTYQPYPISSPTIEITGEIEKGLVTFSLPLKGIDGLSHPIPRLNMAHVYPSRIGVAIYRTHRDDADAEFKPFWNGLLKGQSVENDEAHMECETWLAAMRRRGLVDKWQRLCNYFLYREHGSRCPVSLATHARSCTVTAVSGSTITVSGLGAYADNWFRGGFVEAGDGDVRDVLSWVQSTGVLTMTAAMPSTTIQVGTVLTAYDGCDHLYSTCQSGKFSAETNDGDYFGGFPFGPERNPHQSGIG